MVKKSSPTEFLNLIHSRFKVFTNPTKSFEIKYVILKMKKILFGLVFIVHTTFMANAQISIGPKMGLNISKVPTTETGLPEGNKELFKTGLNIGAAVNSKFSKLISLQAELLFSQKGYRDQWEEQSDPVEETVTANYVDLAFLPRITFGENMVKGYLNAGPSIGYFISGKTSKVIDEDLNEDKIDFEKLDDPDLDLRGLKRVEIGLNAGGGVLLAAGSGNIALDLRYTYGVTPLRKWIDKNGNNSKWNNSVIALTFGYLFEL